MVMLEPIRVLSETTANWLAGRGYACSAPAGRPTVPTMQPFAGPSLVKAGSENPLNVSRRFYSRFFLEEHIFTRRFVKMYIAIHVPHR